MGEEHCLPLDLIFFFFFQAKVNNSSLIGLGYTQTLKPGIKLTLSALLDGKNVNAGGHKLGLGLEFQA